MRHSVVATGRHGDGVVLDNGHKLYIPGALAGDEVELTLDATGSLQQFAIVSPGAAHGTPVCQHFPLCGGCKMQHMRAEAYDLWKQAFVREALAANGLEPGILYPPHISPPQSRRRATFAVIRRGKECIIGLNQSRSHSVVPLVMCSVLRPEIVALLPALRTVIPVVMGGARAMDVRVTFVDGRFDIVLIGGTLPGMAAREALGLFAQQQSVARICWRKWDKSADELIVQLAPPLLHFPHGTVEMPPGGFLQATEAGQQALINAVAQAVGAAAPVADLFCGIGTFALALSPRPLAAIDGDGAAIAALQRAVQGRPKTVVAARNLVREPLSAEELKPYKAVILDPPRDGAKAQAQQLAASKVPLVVSVSCDLDSFCRDGKILQAGGYKLASVQVVDQFLWSTHVELVGVFCR